MGGSHCSGECGASRDPCVNYRFRRLRLSFLFLSRRFFPRRGHVLPMARVRFNCAHPSAFVASKVVGLGVIFLVFVDLFVISRLLMVVL